MISRVERFTADQPCPICQGHDDLPRGHGQRCWGFRSADGHYAHCTRGEYAGSLRQHQKTEAYVHRLIGDCHCGTRHDPEPSPVSNGASAKARIIATYDYCDAHGTLLFQAVRYAPKAFKLRRPDGHGGWTWNLNGVRRVLYRLPELLAADLVLPVLIPEGEKNVDRLRTQGFVAVCNPEGAGKWQPGYNHHLRGRDVVILPDHDRVGIAHGHQVAKSLINQASRLRWLEFPDLPEHGDVSTWLDAGHTKEDLLELIDNAPPYRPAVMEADQLVDGHQPQPIVVTMSEVTSEPIEWLWWPYLARGKLAMLDGDPGTGKSLLMTQLAASLSRGHPLPDQQGTFTLPGVHTIFVQKLSLMYYTHNCLGDSPGLFFV